MIRPTLVFFSLFVAPALACAQGFPKVLSGLGDDDIKGSTTDASGNLYILGEFDGGLTVDPTGAFPDLVDTDGADDGDEDIFVVRFSPDGRLTLAFSFGSFFDDDPGDIAVDAAGNIFVGGSADEAVDFDPGPGTDIRGIAGTDEDPFVAKYASDGTLLWAAMLPTTIGGDVVGMATDASGSVYVAGSFDGSADFDPSGTSFILPSGGPIAEDDDDGFVWKLDGDGGFLWATHSGGTGFDEILDIAVDASETPFALALYTSGSPIRIDDTASFDPTMADSDGSRTDAGGPVPALLTFGPTNGIASGIGFLLGSAADSMPLVFGNALNIDGNGRFQIAGDYLGEVDFDPAPDSAQATASGTAPTGFLWTLTSAGSFDSISTFEGDDVVTLDTVDTDANDNILLGGDFFGTVTLGMDPMMNLIEFTSTGMDPFANRDALLFKLNSAGELQWGSALGGTGDETVDGMVTDANGNTYLSGQFAGLTDLDPGSPNDAVISIQDDLFIAKFTPDGETVRAPTSSGGTTTEDTAVPISFLPPAEDTAAVTHYRLAGTTDATVFADSMLTMPIMVDDFLPVAMPLTLYAQPDPDFFGDLTLILQSASGADILDTGGALEVMVPVESAPDVTQFSSAIVGPTSLDQVTFDLQFDEDVTGVDTSDLVLDATGVTGAMIDSITGSGAAYTVTVLTGTGDGSIQVDLVDDDSIVDVDDGNPLTGAGTLDGSASSDTVVVEKTQVDLSITASLDPAQMLGAPPTVIVVVRNDGPDLAAAASVSIVPGPEFGVTTWTCSGSSGAMCVSGADINDAGSGPVTATVDVPAAAELVYQLTGSMATNLMQTISISGTVVEATGTDLDSANNMFDFASTIGLFSDGFETP